MGSNPNAAIYARISVGKTQFWAFVFSGALSGLAGYLWVARYSLAYVDIAIGFELEMVAACVIGGVAISGGIGSIAGAVLGARMNTQAQNIPDRLQSPFLTQIKS